MVEQLVRDRSYDLHPAVAAALIKHRRVLPVLDGLDEMDAQTTPVEQSRARAALKALNDLAHGRGPAPVVVTCLDDRYAALAARGYHLRDAAWIALQPVSARKVVDYLRQRATDGRWEPVLTALTSGHAPALAQVLTTPWRLTLAATVYADTDDPGHLLTLTTADDVDAHLLARFVPAAARLHPPTEGRITPEQAHRWLHELAAYLNTPTPGAGGAPGAGGTDLVLHHLWPIAGPRRARYAHALVCCLIVMIAGGALCALSLLSPTAPSVLFVTAAAVVVCVLGLRRWTRMWPRPRRPIGLGPLRTVNALWRAVKSSLAVIH